MSLSELREEAEQQNIDYPATARKSDLIALLRKQRRETAWFERSNAWLTLLGALFGVIATLLGVYREMFFCDRDCRAERIVLTRQVVPVVRGMPPYVRRPLIEAALEHVIGHIDQSYGRGRCAPRRAR